MKKAKIGHFIVLIILFLSDQYTKYLALVNLAGKPSLKLIEKFFYLTYVENTGAAWSILSGYRYFFIVVGFIGVIFMLGFYFHSERSLSKIAFTMMLAGTLGNLVDRFRFSGVRDFLDFYIFGYDFPIFNIADCCLCIGAALLMFDWILEEKNWLSRK